MAFAVICKSCQARFLLNDDLLRRRVAGKVVTVRCRQCHATIEVDALDVDPKTLPANEKPLAPAPAEPAAHAVKTMTFKAAPAPPRPVKTSTLMGMGVPKPAGASELVALSPGLMSVSVPIPGADPALGYPEPPPPPRFAEELNADDWDIPDPPAPVPAARPLPGPKPVPAARAVAAPPKPSLDNDGGPESVDDFIEELPPSLPPTEEEIPSSTGTPSLKALAHHDEPAREPRVDDFLANMSAAMNGGVMAPNVDARAPTIDVSTLAAEPVTAAPSIDMSAFDVPLAGKQTLPLFALPSEVPATLAAPRPPKPAATSAVTPTEGSLSPASLDRPASDPDATGQRERKYVVAPVTPAAKPAAAAQRRSGLAAPVLLALAAAAGFLIWKRGAAPSASVPQAEPAAQVADAPVAPALPAAVAPTQPAAPTTDAAVAAPVAVAAADDVTFETTPTKAPAVPTLAPHDKGVATPSPTPDVAEKPAAPDKPAAPERQPDTKPDAPVAKEAPEPPGEPAGPFDRAAASAALSSGAAAASACRKDGDPSGVASVVITFAPSGRVTSANISGPPFAGTPTGGCIAAALRKVRVPAFDGERVTVSKTIVIQ